MKKYLFLFSTIFLKVQLLANFDINTDISFGENNYKRYFFSLGISSENYFVTASYSKYSSNFLFTRKEFSITGGYIIEKLKISLTVGTEPYSDGFSSNFVGFDSLYKLISKENLEIGTGLSILYKENKDSYTILNSTTTGRKRKDISTLKTSEYKINETYKKLYLDLSHNIFNLNFSYTDISYTNTKLTPTIQKAVSNLFITDGYIQMIFSTSLDINLNIFTLKTSYTKSNYLNSSKDIQSIYTSLQKDFRRYSIGLGHERYKDNYYSDKGDIYSLNLSFYF